MFETQYDQLVSQADIARTNRAMIALRLHKFPSEVDHQPALDVWDLLGVLQEEDYRNTP